MPIALSRRELLLGILPTASLMAPGVYVEEVAKGPAPISPADSTTAGFVGLVKAAAVKSGILPADRTVTSYAEFVAAYGPLGQQAVGVSPEQHQKVRAFHLAVRGYFENGGRKARIAPTRSASAADVRSALLRLAGLREVSFVAVPGLIASDVRTAVHEVCSQADILGIIDGIESPASWNSRQAVLGAPFASSSLAAYSPWLRVQDPSNGETIAQPPAGHVCGVIARTAAQRGVWKAPAGTEAALSGIAGVTAALSASQRDQLAPIGINPIVTTAGAGIAVGGARTIADDPERKYVPVVRLRNHVRRSIIQSTGWAVMEPNAAATYALLQSHVTDFLASLHRAGALMGTNPRDAFYVRCGVGTTMTATDVANGHKILEAGIAALKPAEFLVIRIRWTAAGAGT